MSLTTLNTQTFHSIGKALRCHSVAGCQTTMNDFTQFLQLESLIFYSQCATSGLHIIYCILAYITHILYFVYGFTNTKFILVYHPHNIYHPSYTTTYITFPCTDIHPTLAQKFRQLIPIFEVSSQALKHIISVTVQPVLCHLQQNFYL